MECRIVPGTVTGSLTGGLRLLRIVTAKAADKVKKPSSDIITGKYLFMRFSPAAMCWQILLPFHSKQRFAHILELTALCRTFNSQHIVAGNKLRGRDYEAKRRARFGGLWFGGVRLEDLCSTN